MLILNGTKISSFDPGPYIATIGNFDGVHAGHRAIIERVKERGKEHNIRTIVITFDPHPPHVVSPGSAPKLIHTRHQKIRTIEEMGIDILLFIAFDRDFSLLSAEEFLDHFILDRLKINEIYVGENFRLGRNREADAQTLSAIGKERGFAVGIIGPVTIEGEIVSSSIIRKMVEAGDVTKASRFLGRPFSIEGEVITGEGIGKAMKIPTANVRPDNELIPRIGVYITESLLPQGRYKSVTNIGVRPTFNLLTRTIETHLIDFSSSIYGEDIEVFFHQRIRDEMKFSSVEELKRQIEIDIEKANIFFSRR